MLLLSLNTPKEMVSSKDFESRSTWPKFSITSETLEPSPVLVALNEKFNLAGGTDTYELMVELLDCTPSTESMPLKGVAGL